MPDIKLQHKLYHQYDLIGTILAISSGISIFGASFVFVILKCSKNHKVNQIEIFGQTAKLDFLLSISFFISTAGNSPKST